jgi:iron(III) transport system substrate-binding protein
MAGRMRKPVPLLLVLAGLVLLAGLGWWIAALATREDLATAANREGVLEIWSTTDSDRVDELLGDFRKLHPAIEVVYSDLHGSDMQSAFLRAAKENNGTADLLWSSAMDLQVKLLNDGYAMTYRSPEAPNLPDWAKWKDQAWGITAEPIVIVYNKKLIGEDQVPRSHAALRKLLESTGPDDRREVATYDPVRSAVGYLYLSQDEQASNDIWRLVRAMARNKVRLYTSAEEILRDVSAGRVAIGYNIVGSYALDELSKNPNIGVVLPQDYTLVMSRIAMIPSRARHPATAKLFLDFLLSRQGQRRLAERRITPARGDIDLPPPLATDAAPLRAIRVGPALLVSNDRLTRQHFLALWTKAIAAPADR